MKRVSANREEIREMWFLETQEDFQGGVSEKLYQILLRS